jgi:hypothetical protein
MGDPASRLDKLEQSVMRLADDAERAADVGGKWEIVRSARNVVLKPWQWALLNPTAGAFTAMLPPASSCALSQVRIKNDSASVTAITVKVQGGGTIDGASSNTMNTARLSRLFVSDGREWKVL